MRIQKTAEHLEYFDEAQAGFRSLEEAIAQYCALLDALERRSIAGLKSYIVFIDLKKAYDTVPHEALFQKLESYGFSGKCLQYLRNLYNKSNNTCKGDFGFSKIFRQFRGLRQGCPSSTTLFNLFINDILVDIKSENLGARIPGIKGLLSGLLFADDLVIMAESKDSLRKMLNHLSKWASKWQMTFSVKANGTKTAVMGIGPYTREILEAGNKLRIQKEEVPIINNYEYLGGSANKELDKKEILSTQIKKLSTKTNKFTKILRSKVLSADLRTKILLNRIYPSALYLSPYTGMQEDNYDKMQTIANKAIRSIVTNSRIGREWTPLAPISMELNIPTLHALASSQRARLGWKAKHEGMKTQIAKSINNLYSTRKYYWAKATRLTGIFFNATKKFNNNLPLF
eukprot:Lithocolla_globosa_v1_NODE_50_length_7733_cov_357.538291.p3 type:complete len:400 gc:universal NODE_50_length_7733_cov_357.538291:5984-4785(-)